LYLQNKEKSGQKAVSLETEGTLTPKLVKPYYGESKLVKIVKRSKSLSKCGSKRYMEKCPDSRPKKESFEAYPIKIVVHPFVDLGHGVCLVYVNFF